MSVTTKAGQLAALRAKAANRERFMASERASAVEDYQARAIVRALRLEATLKAGEAEAAARQAKQAERLHYGTRLLERRVRVATGGAR